MTKYLLRTPDKTYDYDLPNPINDTEILRHVQRHNWIECEYGGELVFVRTSTITEISVAGQTVRF